MSQSSPDRRTLTSLSTGAKWCLVLGLPLLFLAGFFFLTPIGVPQSGQGLFYCGSPASPNDDPGAVQVCEPVEKMARNKALTSLASAVGIPLLGLALFGVEKRTQAARRVERRDDERFDRRDGERQDRRDDDGFDHRDESRRDERRPLRGAPVDPVEDARDEEHPAEIDAWDDEVGTRHARRDASGFDEVDDDRPVRPREDDWGGRR